jgi:hypothetical protein
MGDTIVEIDGLKIYNVTDYFKSLGYGQKSKEEMKVSV